MYTYKVHRDYIELFYNGIRLCACDNWREVQEEIEAHMNVI